MRRREGGGRRRYVQPEEKKSRSVRVVAFSVPLKALNMVEENSGGM